MRAIGLSNSITKLANGSYECHHSTCDSFYLSWLMLSEIDLTVCEVRLSVPDCGYKSEILARSRYDLSCSFLLYSFVRVSQHPLAKGICGGLFFWGYVDGWFFVACAGYLTASTGTATCPEIIRTVLLTPPDPVSSLQAVIWIPDKPSLYRNIHSD